MMYAAKIVADSIAQSVRLTTFEVTFPRFILAEFNTHRMLSRNSASSRAIPVERRIEQVYQSPFVPEAFTVNKRGMQADKVLEDVAAIDARKAWVSAANAAVVMAQELAKLGVHKQHANRLLEPFAWHTVVVTATEWENFWKLRISKNAQPEMFKTAALMKEVFEGLLKPVELQPGEWHLPYVRAEDAWCSEEDHTQGCSVRCARGANLVKLSVARCAAVSYERQNADRPLEAAIARHNDLLVSGHMSPFEHQAQVWPTLQPPFVPRWKLTDYGVKELRAGCIPPDREWMTDGYFCGNFRAPWLQYRKMIPNEFIYRGD